MTPERKTGLIGAAIVAIVAISFMAGSLALSRQVTELKRIELQREELEARSKALTSENERLAISLRERQKEITERNAKLSELNSQVNATESLFSDIQKAETAYVRKRWGEASTRFCAAHQKLPDFSHIAVRCGWSLYRAALNQRPKGGWEDLRDRSISVLRDASLRDDPNQFALYHYALVLAGEGDDPEAYAILQKVVDDDLKKRMLEAPQLRRLRNPAPDSELDSAQWFASIRKDLLEKTAQGEQ